jgi:hypothetical protein
MSPQSYSLEVADGTKVWSSYWIGINLLSQSGRLRTSRGQTGRCGKAQIVAKKNGQMADHQKLECRYLGQDSALINERAWKQSFGRLVEGLVC